jgi:type VI secretion system FHA domain protein
VPPLAVPPVQRGSPQRIESPPPPRVAPPTADDPLAALLDGEPPGAAAPSRRSREDPLGLLAEPEPGSSAPVARSLDAQVPAPPTSARKAAAAPVLTAPIVQAFLEGAGMAGVKIRDDQAEAFIRECGEVCRAAIEGLMGLLLARATVKEELRAHDRTMVAAHENNPLKLVESVDEAIKFVLDPANRTEAFLPPPKAVADACSDLRSHEIALVAGMRSALLGAIRRFDPAKLERLLEKQGGTSLLANRKAKLWDCFLEHYDKTNSDAEDNFDKVFGADFLRAYQEQVKRLRKG